MEFNHFKSLISQISSKSLGGIATQFELAPKIRKPFSQAFIED
jgi:hypothetical protein